MDTQCWLLKRSCSLTPGQFCLAYAVLCLFSIVLAIPFLLLGYWQVFACAALEMLLVGVAFLAFARHATDREKIELTRDCLLVEQVVAGQVRRTRLHPSWTRVLIPERYGQLVGLQAGGVKVEIGQFVSNSVRVRTAYELKLCVAGASRHQPPAGQGASYAPMSI